MPFKKGKVLKLKLKGLRLLQLRKFLKKASDSSTLTAKPSFLLAKLETRQSHFLRKRIWSSQKELNRLLPIDSRRKKRQTIFHLIQSLKIRPPSLNRVTAAAARLARIKLWSLQLQRKRRRAEWNFSWSLKTTGLLSLMLPLSSRVASTSSSTMMTWRKQI